VQFFSIFIHTAIFIKKKKEKAKELRRGREKLGPYHHFFNGANKRYTLQLYHFSKGTNKKN